MCLQFDHLGWSTLETLITLRPEIVIVGNPSRPCFLPAKQVTIDIGYVPRGE